jgi:meiotically up-regulated gene 157 (Mug157) protein
MFAQCFPNTLDTTVYASPGSTFVITGDIAAMWLRDSTNQVLGYIPFVTQDAPLDAMIQGLIARQTEAVLLDPWANAFQRDATQPTPNAGDQTTRASYLGTQVDANNRLIFERKFEIDSLAAFLKLGGVYYEASKSLTPFTSDVRFCCFASDC